MSGAVYSYGGIIGEKGDYAETNLFLITNTLVQCGIVSRWHSGRWSGTKSRLRANPRRPVRNYSPISIQTRY
jgi:hypothetical protein